MIPNLRLHRLARPQAGVAVAEVGTDQRIVDIRGGVPVGHNAAQGGLGQHVTRHARHDDVAGLHVLELGLSDCEGANVPFAKPAAQFAAVVEIDRLPGLA